MDKGQKLWKSALKVIPGGNMLLSKRAEMFLPEQWPAYYSKAKGCKIWDLEKNVYTDMSLMGEEFVAPRNEIEQQLAAIWCDVLKLEQIGVNDNFFSMGGDSIISIQLVSKMRNDGFNLLVKDIFTNKTIAQLSAHLASTQDAQIEIK